MIDRPGREAVAVSVNDRLKVAAKQMGGDMNFAFQFVQARYVYERLMARLQQTDFSELWSIKGGVMMLALPREVHRATLDMDFSSSDGGKLSVTACLQTLCDLTPEIEDGLSLQLLKDGKDAPRAIREEARNPTVRAKLVATLCLPRPNERRFVVDVTGCEQDYVPQDLEWRPTIKGFAPFVVKAYPWELAFAEKLHAVMVAGGDTPRLRDYMDVIAMSDAGVVDRDLAAFWLRNTFETRNGGLDGVRLDGVGLTLGFAKRRQADWSGTLARTGYVGHMPSSLQQAIEKIIEIAEPVVKLALQETPFPKM